MRRVKSRSMRLILALLALVLLGPASATTVTTFEGADGRLQTEIFEVTGPWDLEWDFRGTALRVEIYHADTSRQVGNPVRQAGTGIGSASFQKPGAYYLKIKSVGEYRLTIAQSEVEASLPTYSGGTERKGTPIITVPHGWGFRWTFQGAAFKLALYDKDRRMIGEEIKNVGGGSGERFVGKPGEYFFMIKSTGNYKIELFQR